MAFDGINIFFGSIEDGSVICVSELHPKKVVGLILHQDVWIVICVSDTHPEKAKSPKYITKNGIVICVNDEHSAKA